MSADMEPDVPQYLYFRVDMPHVVEGLREYFYAFDEVMQGCFSAQEFNGILRFSKKRDISGYDFISGAITEYPENLKGWKKVGENRVIPDASTPEGFLFLTRIKNINEDLKKFYDSYKTAILEMIGWPLKVVDVTLTDEHYLEVNVSHFDLFISQDQSDIYLRINNPDFFRSPERLHMSIPRDMCEQIADVLCEWEKPNWLIPTTKDEVEQHVLAPEKVLQDKNDSFKSLRQRKAKQNLQP